MPPGGGPDSGRRRRTTIGRAAEAEHREENDAQKNQPQRISDILAERLGQVNEHDKRHDDIHERNQEQDNPPSRAAHNFQHDNNVVNGNNRRPAGLTGFGEDLPHRSNDENDDPKIEDHAQKPADHASGGRTVWIGILGEQVQDWMVH